MLIVRGTKKLRDRVKGAPAAAPDDMSTTELGDWFVNALFWKPQVAMLVNARTFLPVFMPLAPASTLLDRIPAAIAEVLGRHGVPAPVIEAELAQMSDVRLAPTNSRQVLGVMNEFAADADGVRHRVHGDLLALSVRMSQMILGPLMQREGTPVDELAAIFGSDAKIIPFPIRPDSVDHPTASPTGPTGWVAQLKITLRDIKPPVWRRVVVDGGQSLNHVHDVIQAAFGWYDSHLHAFEIDGTDYGIPHEEDWRPVQDERRTRIDQVLGARTFRYTYDFGDNWVHDVVVEKTFDATDDGAPATVPDCLDGRRAGPPEDCGGPWGYAELLEILADRDHPEHEERVEWLEQPFDAEAFDAATFADDLELQQLIRFDDDY